MDGGRREIPPVSGGKRKYCEHREGNTISARAWMALPDPLPPFTKEIVAAFERRLSNELFPAAKPEKQPIEYCFFVRERRVKSICGTVIEYQTRRGGALLAFSLLCYLTEADGQTVIPPTAVVGRRGKRLREFCLCEQGLLPLSVREIGAEEMISKKDAFGRMVLPGELFPFSNRA